MRAPQRFRQTVRLILTASVFLVPLVAAMAQQRGEPFWTQGQAQRGAEAARVRFSQDGYVKSAGAAPGTSFRAGVAAAAAPDEVAAAFLASQATWFYDGAPGVGFRMGRVATSAGRSNVKVSQTYKDVPVFGAGVVVQVRGGDVEYVLSDIMRDFSALTSGVLSTTPLITAAEAQTFGVAWVTSKLGATAPQATAPTLEIYDPQVVGNQGPSALVWRFEVDDSSPTLREVVLVNAEDGEVLFNYSLIHDALNRQIYDSNNTTADPGTPARFEGAPATGVVDVNQAYDFLGDTYNFYFNEHGRDSLDNAGAILSATVRFCDPFYTCPFANAYWDGSRMYFGDGFTVDDVTAHELTHGVTTNESNLVYANQSGAINESFSDMWGEWVDLGNGAGTDTAGVRWLMGEDIPSLGAIRDMSDPPAFGDPDRMGSPLYYTGTADSGGVHTNSGVGNKLAYLLTDGDTFNSYAVTAMGIPATADLMYECQTNLLTPSSDYFDLYDAITQAAINIGFSVPQRDNVESACRAVEIRFIEGVTGFQATATSGVPQIDLTWTNPAAGSFTEVRVRRSTTSFPVDPDVDGTLIYQGTATSYMDASVSLGTLYYYSIWAYHGPSDYSGASNASATAGVPESSPTEQFTGGGDSFDLENMTIIFTPNGGSAYDVSRQYGVSSFNVPPSGGTLVSLGDDDFQQITLTGGDQIPLFGTNYSSYYISSNGRVTFGSGSTDFSESLADHFAIPGVAALFDDLNPSVGGQVRVEQQADRAVVSFVNVPEYSTSNQNNFQIEMFFSGVIRITYLNVASNDSVVGVSAGAGTPTGFVETDLSGVPMPGAPVRPWALALVAIALVAAGWATVRTPVAVRRRR